MTTSKSTTAGKLRLSVQASADHDCHPRKSGLDMADYTHVEVAIYQGKNRVSPSKAGLEAFAPYFNDQDIAPCMAQEVLAKLKAAMEAL